MRGPLSTRISLTQGSCSKQRITLASPSRCSTVRFSVLARPSSGYAFGSTFLWSTRSTWAVENDPGMSLTLYILAVLAGLGLFLGLAYWRWQNLIARELFLLSMKKASTPGEMTREERRRLALLRSPWWAFWRWLPDLKRRRPLDFS